MKMVEIGNGNYHVLMNTIDYWYYCTRAEIEEEICKVLN